MKSLILGLSMILASPAFAHIAIGTYKGVDANGQACSFDVTAVTFEDGARHPLNERVAVMFNQIGFVLRHAPSVDVTRSVAVTFEKDMLSGVKGYSDYTWAFLLKMVHDEQNDGPTEMTIVKQDNRNPSMSTKSICKNLVAPLTR
ncbi:MAG: hypothetical protein AB7F59_11465 [Bdellovibrionales bacterium]